MLKRLFIVLGLVIVVVLALGYQRFLRFQQLSYEKWTAQSQLMQTRQGPLEYQIKGKGEPILQFHGTPSSYRGNLNFPLYQPLFDDRFSLISVSRPGYLRTPLATGATPTQQADAFSELVSNLGYQQVVVVGISGGGPSALAFAHRHPEQCKALILIEALALPLPEDKRDGRYARLIRLALDHTYLAWLASPVLSQYFPNQGRQNEMELAFEEYLSLFPYFADGLQNDVRQFERLTPLAQPITRCPTLILHGLEDEVVGFDNATAVLAHIPNAKLVPFGGAGHELFYTQAGAISAYIADFVSPAVP
ncbi:alpha/beta fold hydrolase [Gallaecimonas pentaromativorans]|uniref:Pimeloyl-ACP methyl ester carboxylesterase n=1 Tax=Gallaecimonas pentaromativorans TaxID=584787 RepID=A0A3N1PFS3_9GAMM|nr:alpha/beta hydrolase [Gallaecimonas pentaromativorans]MED5525445.1 alpha/beta hydrolase [Pseudomonadota bacterium]ROQ27505.1 pimeloyl-ACP methyl ester carboxylesterase [Gallaecimonas pentaromativorans]